MSSRLGSAPLPGIVKAAPALVPVVAMPPRARLPAAFSAWFRAHGWTPHPHQLEVLAAARAGESVLLVAPTGGG